jgi:hypothetical protein
MQNNIFEDINLEPEETDLEIEVQKYGHPTTATTEPQQRTPEWRKARMKHFTGSRFKSLMSCNPKGSKKSWSDKSKIFDFSSGVVKYIFEVAKERQTGRYIESGTNLQMIYGTNVENFAFRRANEHLKSFGLKLETVNFKEFDSFVSAGASADAKVIEIESGKTIAVGEIKCCTSWGALFDRTYENMDEKSGDFWQTQGEMKAWNVEEAYYIVITPPKDIRRYLRVLESQEDTQEELYKEWCLETEIEIQRVKASPLHIEALFTRLEIAEKTIKEYLSENSRDIKDVLDCNISEAKAKYLFNDITKENVFKTGETDELETNETNLSELPVINASELPVINASELPVIYEEVKKEQEEQKEPDFEDLPF